MSYFGGYHVPDYITRHRLWQFCSWSHPIVSSLGAGRPGFLPSVSQAYYIVYLNMVQDLRRIAIVAAAVTAVIVIAQP
jgi:hypothetical protein